MKWRHSSHVAAQVQPAWLTVSVFALLVPFQLRLCRFRVHLLPCLPLSHSCSLNLCFFFFPISLWLILSTFNQPFSHSSLPFALPQCTISPPVPIPHVESLPACLSVCQGIWIIEVYWVWSAYGETAIVDLSVLFRKRWVYADTCPVKAHGSFAGAQGRGGGSQAGRASPQHLQWHTPTQL